MIAPKSCVGILRRALVGSLRCVAGAWGLAFAKFGVVSTGAPLRASP